MIGKSPKENPVFSRARVAPREIADVGVYSAGRTDPTPISTGWSTWIRATYLYRSAGLNGASTNLETR